MKVLRGVFLFVLVACATAPVTYPPARRMDHVDTYHGIPVADPYRWMEDLQSAEVRSWIEAQNRVTFSFLDPIPERRQLRERLTELFNYERMGSPFRKGGRIFYYRNDGLQNQSVLWVMDRIDSAPRILLDPNTLSPDGTIALQGVSISENGSLLAYGLSRAGSDWQEWRVREIESGKDRPDILQWVKASYVSWGHDHLGFYYWRYDPPKPGEEHKAATRTPKISYHQVGRPQSEDAVIFQRADHPDWMLAGRVSQDGRSLVITIRTANEPKNMILLKDLAAPSAAPAELISTFDASYGYVGNDGPVYFFHTDSQAPMNRLIAIDARTRERRTVIPEAPEALIQVSLVADRFIARYLKDACSRVKIYRLDGTFERELKLPGLGSATGFMGEKPDPDTFFNFTGFTVPSTVYRFDPRTGTLELFRRPKVAFDPDRYETHQVFYTSKDGTRVPMFLVHRKGLILDGNNPTLLYGYGGFNISQTPEFSVTRIAWLERGGVYALANIRGGGEYGREWHQAGTKTRKQNVFDDFIAAAEWLIDRRYTRPAKLAIEGRSNGGLLVGACMIQRPDLFGACLPGVGVMDMLRFQQFTVGWAWASDYGSIENETEFKTLRAYSPYHNLKPGTRYPPTLITTADHDDRVFPAHSFKFAAALQAAQAGPGPILIRIETDAGHGAGTPTAKLIEEVTDKLSFLIATLCKEPR